MKFETFRVIALSWKTWKKKKKKKKLNKKAYHYMCLLT